MKKNLDTGKEEHIDISPRLLSIWAAAIVRNKACVASYPIHIEEFAILWENRSKGKRPHKSASTTTISASERSINVTVNNTTPPYRCTPEQKRQKRVPLPLPSPIPGVSRKDYNGEGLLKYLTWLDEEYETDLCDTLFEALRHKDIGLGHFKGGILAEIIKQECEINIGTAWRLVNEYGRWEEEQ